MGLSSSKTKGNNVTLVKSKCSDEELPDNSTATPLRKILPFDPRSPTENFSRTPIVVTAGEDGSPATPANIKVLEVDPRSPSQQVSRTPIVVEKNSSCCTETPKSCGVRTKPHALHSPEESLQSDDDTDPRSPTVTVPRTPLEQKLFKVSIHDSPTSSPTVAAQTGEESCSDEQDSESKSDDESASKEDVEKENQPQTPSFRADKPSKEGLVPRSPLSCSNRNNCSTPRNLLQARQCRTLEEEFTKNQRNILAQIAVEDDEGEAVVPSTTQFVEQI